MNKFQTALLALLCAGTVGCTTVVTPKPQTQIFDKMVTEEVLPDSYERKFVTVVTEDKKGNRHYCKQEVRYDEDGNLVAPRLCKDDMIAIGVFTTIAIFMLSR